MVKTRLNTKVKGTGKALLGLQLEQKGDSTKGQCSGGLPKQRKPSALGKFMLRFSLVKYANEAKGWVPPPDWSEESGTDWLILVAIDNLAHWCFLELSFKWALYGA